MCFLMEVLGDYDFMRKQSSAKRGSVILKPGLTDPDLGATSKPSMEDDIFTFGAICYECASLRCTTAAKSAGRRCVSDRGQNTVPIMERQRQRP